MRIDGGYKYGRALSMGMNGGADVGGMGADTKVSASVHIAIDMGVA